MIEAHIFRLPTHWERFSLLSVSLILILQVRDIGAQRIYEVLCRISSAGYIFCNGSGNIPAKIVEAHQESEFTEGKGSI